MCSTSSKEVDFDDLEKSVQKQILEAVEARKASYSPYTKFAVGACVECDDGTLFKGCNIENYVLGLSICAEQTAIAKAISEGRRKFKSIAVIGQQENLFTAPCGSCRQFMTEFSTDMSIYLTRPTLGKVLVTNIKELLPYMFTG